MLTLVQVIYFWPCLLHHGRKKTSLAANLYLQNVDEKMVNLIFFINWGLHFVCLKKYYVLILLMVHPMIRLFSQSGSHIVRDMNPMWLVFSCHFNVFMYMKQINCTPLEFTRKIATIAPLMMW